MNRNVSNKKNRKLSIMPLNEFKTTALAFGYSILQSKKNKEFSQNDSSVKYPGLNF
jgi:hypothetical protein